MAEIIGGTLSITVHPNSKLLDKFKEKREIAGLDP
jgi:hypothetical protein